MKNDYRIAKNLRRKAINLELKESELGQTLYEIAFEFSKLRRFHETLCFFNSMINSFKNVSFEIIKMAVKNASSKFILLYFF